MSVSLSVSTKPVHRSSQPKTKSARKWNDEVFSWLDDAGFRPSEKITVAGPPNCSDRPWWFGRVPDADERHRSSQDGYTRDRELEEKNRVTVCMCPRCRVSR